MPSLNTPILQANRNGCKNRYLNIMKYTYLFKPYCNCTIYDTRLRKWSFRNLRCISVKMSSVIKKRVNLEFINTGLQFEDIAVGDENQTLGEFIESTLMRLEVNYDAKACTA